MYAAKFKLDTVAAVFKIGGKDLGQPIGRRAKSVVGNDELQVLQLKRRWYRGGQCLV